MVRTHVHGLHVERRPKFCALRQGRGGGLFPSRIAVNAGASTGRVTMFLHYWRGENLTWLPPPPKSYCQVRRTFAWLTTQRQKAIACGWPLKAVVPPANTTSRKRPVAAGSRARHGSKETILANQATSLLRAGCCLPSAALGFFPVTWATGSQLPLNWCFGI